MPIDKTQSIAKDLANLYIKYFNQRKGDFRVPTINLSLSQSTNITIFDNIQLVTFDLDGIPVYETSRQLQPGQQIGLYDTGMKYQTDVDALTVPMFITNAGADQSWIINTAIVNIIVPQATGNPVPVYSVVGNLPSGLSFDANTRIISGTPDTIGNGTITIRATNSQGSDNWTIDYSVMAMPVTLTAPNFATDTIADRSWRQDTAIASITVPQATGNPTPTYAVVGNLPSGLAFDTMTRVISGTPTGTGTGTITIRATNSQGSDDWTVDYSIAAALVAPVFNVDMGADQSWVEDTAITNIVIPVATGNPTPTYSVVGSLPNGLNFNANSRTLSGTPTSVGTGTITIRATNSEGTDNWTLDYAITAAPVMQTIPVFTSDMGVLQTWRQNTAITNVQVPMATQNPTYAVVGNLPAGLSFNTNTRVISGTPTNTGTGTITIRATNPIGSDDWTIDYSIAAELVAPVFSPDTETAKTWREDIAITNIVVPQATGNPTPTYAVVGSLPSGLSFNANTRTISGTPTTASSGTITIRATNSEGSDDWTVDYTIDIAFAIPVFSPDSGTTQSWTLNTAITSITIPTATGNPTPTYSVVGSLPSGLSFDTDTLVLSGTPDTVEASGTITIRATNSEGSDDWTVDYSVNAELTLNAFALPTGHSAIVLALLTAGDAARFGGTVLYGSSDFPAATTGSLDDGDIEYETGADITAVIWLPGTNNRFNLSDNPETEDFNAWFATRGNYSIYFQNEDGDVVSDTISNIIRSSDSGDHFQSFNADSDFTDLLSNLSAGDKFILAITEPPAIPVFSPDTIADVDWIIDTAITDIVVPEATGKPAPIYSVVGSLPSGVTFDVNTRTLSGTPDTLGSGTITIRATNVAGSDDWTVDYEVTAAVVLTVPVFSPDTIADVSWRQNTAITSITIPTATGKPTPTYSVVGNLPSGLSFDTDTRILSGTPTGTGSGTITIRATNSEGTDDWTVDYSIAAELTVPNFATDEGTDKSWTEDIAITNIVVPQATGNPTPNYAVVGNLPAGLSFNANSRTLSGTPTSVGTGTITIRATNSEGSDDWTVDYSIAAGLSAPVFSPDSGTAPNWTQNKAIANITVPMATGNPTPTYAVVGTLPSGLSFNTNTRIISGTPTITGSGTITIRATNSEGSDDWTVDYSIATALTAPNFASSTGDNQNWSIDTAITKITVPQATGNPTPTYSVVGNLPAGLSFNASNRQITGTPTTRSSGTITIRATNSEGSDDWTVDYAIKIEVSLTLPDANYRDLTMFRQSVWTFRQNNYLSIGTLLSNDGTERFLGLLNILRRNGQIGIRLTSTQTESTSDAGDEFSTDFETNGIITLTASDDSSVQVTGFGDSTEPYAWKPSNSSDVMTFISVVHNLGAGNRTITMTFTLD